MSIRDAIDVRFWRNVAVGQPDECWPWTRLMDRDGYGILGYRNRQWRAHRLAWELVNGSIPAGMYVCHFCDNPSCCNPAHLWLGTNRDNLADMKAKRRGRAKSQNGEDNFSAKLTAAQVVEIRRCVAEGESHCSVARRFHIGKTTVGSIANRLTWKHLE